MMVMPVALVGMIKMLSPDMADNFTTPAGIIATTIAIVMFVAAHFVGKAVLNIKV
jgi:tight adherence protein B